MRYARPLLSFLILSAVVPAIANGPAKVANSDAITAHRLKSHLTFVASDEMEGRDTPSRGLNVTARYLESQLMLWGVKPMGDNGTYFQRMALEAPVVKTEGTSATLGGTALKYGETYYGYATAGTASGQVVYLPTAWEKSGDPNSAYAKVDVRGKIVLAPSGRPAGVSFRDIRSGAWLTPQDAGMKHGVKGFVFIAGPGNWDSSVKASTTGDDPEPVQPASGPAEPPSIIVKPEALASLLNGEQITLANVSSEAAEEKQKGPFALAPSKTVSFTVELGKRTEYTQNVVAMIEGTDPNLKGEYVAVGAHYDHLGMRSTGSGDVIYNGADDDGSGTVSVLEIAHALATGPRPKRSVIFVWHCGEEKGLWGSDFFCNNPPVPINSIVAQLNIDMIGRSKRAGDTSNQNKMLAGVNAIYIVGTTRMSTDLGTLAKDVNKKLYNLTYDFTYDDLDHPERIFFRSDHYNYAVHGIPVLFWFDGVHEDYHRVSDEVAKIDFAKMEKVARTVYATAWDLGNRPSRPRVDMPLPRMDR
jgi:hypothetical protein